MREPPSVRGIRFTGDSQFLGMTAGSSGFPAPRSAALKTREPAQPLFCSFPVVCGLVLNRVQLKDLA